MTRVQLLRGGVPSCSAGQAAERYGPSAHLLDWGGAAPLPPQAPPPRFSLRGGGESRSAGRAARRDGLCPCLLDWGGAAPLLPQAPPPHFSPRGGGQGPVSSSGPST